MSSMGGNVVVNSDTLFSSSIQNSSFNFIPTMPFQPFPSMVINYYQPVFFSFFFLLLFAKSLFWSLSLPLISTCTKQKEEDGILRGKEEVESGSGSEQLVEDKSGNEQESHEQPTKKKRYHRHTARQIQEMEAWEHTFFYLSRSLFFFFSLSFVMKLKLKVLICCSLLHV